MTFTLIGISSAEMPDICTEFDQRVDVTAQLGLDPYRPCPLGTPAYIIHPEKGWVAMGLHESHPDKPLLLPVRNLAYRALIPISGLVMDVGQMALASIYQGTTMIAATYEPTNDGRIAFFTVLMVYSPRHGMEVPVAIPPGDQRPWLNTDFDSRDLQQPIRNQWF